MMAIMKKEKKHLTLREYKDKYGLSYAKMGSKFKSTPMSVRNWCLGKTVPRLHKACDIVLETNHEIGFNSMGLE